MSNINYTMLMLHLYYIMLLLSLLALTKHGNLLLSHPSAYIIKVAIYTYAKFKTVPLS